MVRMLACPVILLFLFSTRTQGADSLKVSVPWLLELLVTHSDSISRQRNSLTSEESQVLEIKASFDPRISSTFSHTVDENERSSSSTVAGSDSNIFSVGVSKAFSTGTSLSAEISNTTKEQRYSAVSGLSNDNYSEGSLTVELSQSLLKNSMGQATRMNIKSANLSKNASRFEVQDNIEEYFETMIERYFLIFQSLSSLKSTKEKLAREELRIAIYNRQFQRGFTTKQDILQIQSTILNSKKQLIESSLDIESLLISLGTIIKQDLRKLFINNEAQFTFSEESIDDVRKALW